jgi:hypothetical protein
MSDRLRRFSGAGLVGFALAVTLAAAPLQRDNKSNPKDTDARRPRLTLKAQPTVAIAPARVVLQAELAGGANDFEEYYCPTVDWDWGDGTESESTSDCQPYQAGKTEIKRRFTVEHVFRAGSHHISFRLKRNDKVLTSASVSIQVQPGGGPEGD